MNVSDVCRIEELARKTGHVLVATAAADGMPHVGAAAKVGVDEKGRLVLTEWFCPGTVKNVTENGRVAVVAWDPKQDFGWQALGQVQQVQDVEMMDGYRPDEEKQRGIPQVERALVVKIEKVVRFSMAPHTDATTTQDAK